MAMGPWSETPAAKATRSSALGAAEWLVIVALVALGVVAALALWCSRYEIGTAGGLPLRLDRFTGQVIGCVPSQGCFEFIPAGEPTLHSPALRPMTAPATPPAAAAGAPPAGNAAAAPAAKH